MDFGKSLHLFAWEESSFSIGWVKCPKWDQNLTVDSDIKDLNYPVMNLQYQLEYSFLIKYQREYLERKMATKLKF